MFACEASMQGGEGKVVAKGKIVLLEAFWLCLSALRTSPLLRTSPWSDECAQEYDWTITKKRARFVRFPGWYFRGTYHVRIPCYTMKASTQGFFVPRVKKVKWRPLVLFFLLRFFRQAVRRRSGAEEFHSDVFLFPTGEGDRWRDLNREALGSAPVGPAGASVRAKWQATAGCRENGGLAGKAAGGKQNLGQKGEKERHE